MVSLQFQNQQDILTQRRRGAEAQRKERNKDMQDRKRQDKQDNRTKIKESLSSIFLFLFYYPAYPAACDPAYPCSSLFSAPLRLCASALKCPIMFLGVLLLCVMSFLGAAEDVTVTAGVNSKKLSPSTPIEVRVTVSGPSGMKVDPSNFLYEGQSIKVETLGQQTQRSTTILNGKKEEKNTEIKNYRFELPGKEEGAYPLGTISVEINGATYNSAPTTYQISKGVVSESGLSFEVNYKAADPLYPGETAKVTYRFYYRSSGIELTKEQLAFFQMPGFRAVGEKQFKTSTTPKGYVQEVTQEFEAIKPGSYEVEESIVEGYGYQLDLFGQPVPLGPKMRATAPGRTIVITAFPKEGQPKGFTGAIGPFQIKAEQLGKSSLRVGDKVVLRIQIAGEDLKNIQLPPLNQQKGFKNIFRMSDIPPVKVDKDAVAQFDVEMRPLVSGKVTIPSISFPYFDKETKSYKTVATDPISLEVLPGPTVEDQKNAQKKIENTSSAQVATQPLFAIETNEIDGCLPLNSWDFSCPFWATPKALYLLPLGILLLFLQYSLQKRGARKETPGQLLVKEIREEPNLEKQLLLLEYALQRQHSSTGLLQRLHEARFSGSTMEKAKAQEWLQAGIKELEQT